MESVNLIAIRFREIMRIINHSFSGTGVDMPIVIHHSVFSLILFCGLILAATGIAIIIITLLSYRKAERWSWWCLLFLGILPLFGSFIFNGIVHGFGPIELGSLILFILAITIPARTIFSKKAGYLV